MGLLGFPSESEITGMFGYVTPDDRRKWDQTAAESNQRVDAARDRLSARGLASQVAQPAMDIAGRSINASLHAARTEEARKTQGKQTKSTFTLFTKEEPVSSEEYGPEL